MKKARGASATGFTQKRHTLYAHYSGPGKKIQRAISTNFHADAPKRFHKRGVSALQRNCRGVMPLNFLNSTKKYLVFSTPICRAMLSMG